MSYIMTSYLTNYLIGCWKPCDIFDQSKRFYFTYYWNLRWSNFNFRFLTIWTILWSLDGNIIIGRSSSLICLCFSFPNLNEKVCSQMHLKAQPLKCLNFKDKLYKNVQQWWWCRRPVQHLMYMTITIMYMTISVTSKKSPNVYKSCPKMMSLERWKNLTPLQKLPKNVGDLGKLIVVKGFEKLPKVQ